MATSIHTNGVHHGTDEAIDSLYAWFPPQAPASAPLPEAAFSLTLKGRLDGTEAMLTVRGATAAEFTANLQAVRGLLEPLAPQPQAPAQPPADTKPCPIHHVPMTLNHKDHRSWWSHRTAEGQWCKGK